MATAEIMPLEIRGEDKSAAAWRSLKGNVLEARSAVDSLSQGLRGLQTLSAGSFSTLASSANMATRALTNPFTAAAAAVIAVGTAAYFADQKLSSLGKTAYEVGEAASTIDGLEKAIKRAGGETENAANALKNMQKEVEKAGRDKGDLHELFKVNDSSLKDSQGNLKSLNEVYRQTAQFIQNAASETDRLDIATRAFGSDAAPAMVKAIMDGADALDRLGGNEGLDPLVAQAREFDRMWKEIGGIINEVGYSIRDKLLPAMEAFYGYARLIAAALGSNAAKQSNFLANTPGAQRMWDTGSQREIDQFYKGVFGDKNRTKVPGDEDDEKDSFKKNEFDRAVNSITKHIAIMNAAGSGKMVSIRKVFHINLSLAAVTGVAVRFDVKKATAVSAGTAITPVSCDTDDVLPAGITVATGATVTEGVLLYPVTTQNDELTAANTAIANYLMQFGNLALEGIEQQEYRLRPGEGMTVKQITNTTVGSFAWLMAFTVEPTV